VKLPLSLSTRMYILHGLSLLRQHVKSALSFITVNRQLTEAYKQPVKNVNCMHNTVRKNILYAVYLYIIVITHNEHVLMLNLNTQWHIYT